MIINEIELKRKQNKQNLVTNLNPTKTEICTNYHLQKQETARHLYHGDAA